MEDIKNIVIEHIKKEKKVISSFGEILIDNPSIGQGGNGIVFECKLSGNEYTKNHFAVKFLTITGSKDKTSRFISEFFNVSCLPSNPYVIKNISFENVNIQGKVVPMIIMKRYESNLAGFRKKNKNPSFDELNKLLEFLIQSLKFIHKNGIIHRDLKPENILIDEFGNYVLADFGIAKFNPEFFFISTKTKDTRLANRLFSAPEQSESNVEANETMDIWALGQLLQWFITGKTHNGIGRNPISNFYKSTFANTIDQIIEKCLEHNPKKRFSSISEIENFITKSKFIPYNDYMSYVVKFHDALNYTFPKGINKFNSTTSKDKIDGLLRKISSIRSYKERVDKQKGNMILNLNSNPMVYEIEDGSWSHLDLRNENGVWLLENTEIIVKKIWAYFNNSLYNDYLIIQTEAMPSFGIYPVITTTLEEDELPKTYLTGYDFETVGFVDEKFYISTEEFDAGYAEIEEKTIELNSQNCSLRTRCLKEMFILLGTKHHTYFSPFLNKYKGFDKNTSHFIREFRVKLDSLEEHSQDFLKLNRQFISDHKQYLYSLKDDL